MIKKKKPKRNKIFVDLPVTSDTRELTIKAKKKLGYRTYDDLISKTMADIIGEET